MAHRHAPVGRMRQSKPLAGIVCLALLAAGCGGWVGDGEEPSEASVTTWEWPVSTPEEQGIDSGRLVDLIDTVAASGEINSVTVVRHGHLVMDAVLYPYPESTASNTYSVSKSVTATLIGIAIDQGLLEGVDVPVVEILSGAAPETVDSQKASMTVEDLLTMSTGLECRDSVQYDNEGIYAMIGSDDWAAYVLGLPMIEEPGTHFEYCNGATYLLSAIVTEVTGRSAGQYAEDVLFEPLGITDFAWPEGPQGVTYGFTDLRLEPADMAKLGQLYLQNGMWEGSEVVPASWVEAATTPHPYTSMGGLPASGYGYQWWIDGSGFSARGYGGQYIVVVPLLDLVVVFTSALAPHRTPWPLDLVSRHVVLACKPGALPANPEAEARLEAALERVRSEPVPVAVEQPATANSISGVRYEFQPNDHGHEWFEVRFDQDPAHLTFKGALGPDIDRFPPELLADLGLEAVHEIVEVDIGLDGRYVSGTAWGLPSAWRGNWTSANVFRVEFHTYGGSILRGSIEFTFGDETAEVVIQEVTEQILETSSATRTG